MNKDNLKYIQTQIKQKKKKSVKQVDQEQPPTGPYPELIEEKDSKYEETER